MKPVESFELKPNPLVSLLLRPPPTQGQNIILNMNDHGFVVCAYNRTVEKVDKFLENEAKGTPAHYTHTCTHTLVHMNLVMCA